MKAHISICSIGCFVSFGSGCAQSVPMATAPVEPPPPPAAAETEVTVPPVGDRICTLTEADENSRQERVQAFAGLERRGKLREAIAGFEEVQRKCWVPSMDFHLARLHHDTGDDARARGYARRCAETDRPELKEMGAYSSACNALLPQLRPPPQPATSPPATRPSEEYVRESDPDPPANIHFDVAVGGAFFYAFSPAGSRLNVVRRAEDGEANLLLQLADAEGGTHECPAEACTLTTNTDRQTTGGGFGFSLLAAGSVAGGRIHLGGLGIAGTFFDGSESSPSVLISAGPALVADLLPAPGFVLSLGVAPLVGGMWGIDHYFPTTTSNDSGGGSVVDGTERFKLSSLHETFYGLGTTGLAGGISAPIRLGMAFQTGTRVTFSPSPLILVGPGGVVFSLPLLISIGAG